MFKAVLTGVLLARVSADCGSKSRLLVSSEVAPIILDDADAAGNGWSEGDMSACLEDAYRGTFHHDQSSNKGQISGTYTFDPPKDGCYVIDEHHPGQNRQCSQRLPTNARIDIDYCKGKSTYTHVDQSLGGGEWNVLGALPFYVGWQGKIRVGNIGTGSTCELGHSCLWLADAFKLTWVSDVPTGGCEVPMHHGDEEELATTLTTTLASSQLMASTLNIVHQALDTVQTIIDDVSSNASFPYWKRSTRRACGTHGWQQSFLYKDQVLRIRDPAPAAFVFDPPSDGCYVLEEFHPEEVCGNALSSEVPLSIHYCKGLEKQTLVDQSKNGNRWNTVGTFPFYKGLQGKVLVAQPQGSSSSAAADAFRFTRIASSCHDAVQASMQYQRLSQNAAAILVDNQYSLEGQHSVPSTCSVKALGGSLHAASDGTAEAKFEFIPTSTGCYRIDSFHPEHEGEGCALADNAALEVNWCLGKRTHLTTPLRGKGNQWNTVGHFKFYAGNMGNVISRRMTQTAKGKFWVADAFRFTKVSDVCDAIPEVGHFSFHITGQELKANIPAVLEVGITSYADMRLALHEAVVEATELPYESVQLLSIRRGSVIADFEVRGSQLAVFNSMSKIQAQISPGSESVLKQTLCKAVISDAKGECDVAVIQASVLQSPPGNEEEQDSTLLVVGIVGIATVMLALLFGFLACRHVKKLQKGQANTVATIHVVPKQEIPGKEMDQEVDDLKKCTQKIHPDVEKGEPDADECSQSGSTATPTSSLNPTDMEEVQSI